MKDLGVADIILGVKIRKNENDLSLCQSHYVEKILKKFDSFDVSPIRTPHDASKHKNKGDNVSQPEYTKIIPPGHSTAFGVHESLERSPAVVDPCARPFIRRLFRNAVGAPLL
ncbi:Retrovirus-related Pol polyprotein from transposon TNT 1-94 [Cucumis melo var. makuwa]|uniref:Retrovirus-related Pol polyprotein from transposon TNT 1-94 n=1 Tax=Cucumis melo var. makuwa TaxID=1194695 RepID=A0A5A7UVF7_CUCMM|nr:Retrovirus-related Pol polyprotein from transposon TNT 1-94 [Cucumis melo var. makuwa]TYK24815.1 Retrovirus-related Pol polyprotein from transposon TNT 1-94 [Cucumis melo var. makuwa]